MSSVQQLKDDIVSVGRILLEKGLVAGTWGNISVRIPELNRIAVTPSGRSYFDLAAEDIVVTDLTGSVFEGQYKASSELPMHLAIYRKRPDISAIIHTHSIFASSCAVARTSIPPIIEDLVQMAGGSVDVAQYALPGTSELAENAVMALREKGAVLLANHGVVCGAATLNEAMIMCELVEKAAQIYVYAKQLGSVHVLSEEDVAQMHEFYLKHYRLRWKG